jgi:hypothetical protein
MKITHLVLISGFTLITSQAIALGQQAFEQSGVPKFRSFDPNKLSPEVRGRCQPQSRAQLLPQYGGNKECEIAAIKALDWLKTKQNGDGSWGSYFKSGMTSLALMAFLGHCETPTSPFYGQNVQLGVTYLIDLGKRNRGQISTHFGNSINPYEHAIGTLALTEASQFPDFNETIALELKETVVQGVAIILNRQGKVGKGEGGWTYAAIGRDRFSPPVPERPQLDVTDVVDLSLSIWHIQALLAAQKAGLGSDAITASLKSAAAFVQRNSNPDGSFGHAQPVYSYSRRSMTGLAALAQQVLPEGNRKAATQALELILAGQEKNPLNWEQNSALYSWHFTSVAMFNQGGSAWKTWHEAYLQEILQNQKPDGSFKNDYSEPHTSNHPAISTSATAGGDSEIFRTSLAAMMLEIYYRYPPMPQSPAK